MKVLVVSANMGYRTTNKVVPQDVDVDFVCYNDDNFALRQKAMHPRMVAKIPKMLAWELKPGYDYYIWMDSYFNMNRSDSVSWFLKKINGADAAFFKHPNRDSIASEIDFITKEMEEGNQYLIGRCEGEDLQGQAEHYKAQNWYKDNQLFAACSFIYSSRLVQNTKWNMMKEWYYQVCTGSVRDQISLPYALQMFNVNYNEIDDNPFSCKYLNL